MAGREERGKGATNPAGKKLFITRFPKDNDNDENPPVFREKRKSEGDSGTSQEDLKIYQFNSNSNNYNNDENYSDDNDNNDNNKDDNDKNKPGRPCQRQRPSSELPGKSPENNYSVSKYKI